MDKNFLFALVLTAAVMAAFMSPWYQNRFGREVAVSETALQSKDTPQSTVPQPPSSDSAETVSRETAVISLSEAPLDSLDNSIVRQINTAQEMTITLANKRLGVGISTRGGVITSATTLQFKGASDKEQAQLLAPGQSWYGAIITDGNITIDVEKFLFTLTEQTDNHATLTVDLSGGRSITRTYSFDDNNYLLNVDTTLDGAWNDPRLTFTWNGPVNQTEKPVKQLRIWPFSMFIRDETNIYSKLIYLGQGDRTTISLGKKDKTSRIYSNETQKIDAAKYRTGGNDRFSGDLTWYAIQSKYFMSAVIPSAQTLWDIDASFSNIASGKWYDFSLSKNVKTGSTALTLYMGPISYDTLKESGHRLTDSMELSWRFVRPLAIAFLWLLKKLHVFISNWGIVLIIFSVLVKLFLYPLSLKSIESAQKMSRLQPLINELREKHKNNPQKLQLATMELYKQEGVNPFGGCLPILLQMPVFFALYPVVGRAFELRQAMFIPLWIEDLSRPDPFYILPIAMGISMFFQTKQTVTDPNQKAMIYMMPVMMVILFANFSAGLTLYWLLFNLLTSLQQMIHKPA
jgi:YidC/Oxa1 family membrane protein insertase